MGGKGFSLGLHTREWLNDRIIIIIIVLLVIICTYVYTSEVQMHQLPAGKCSPSLSFAVRLAAEKELNFGDHGYARRNPLPGVEDEDADRSAEDQQPCTQCQLLKKQLEQEMQHTARLQKEVRWLPLGGCCLGVGVKRQ